MRFARKRVMVAILATLTAGTVARAAPPPPGTTVLFLWDRVTVADLARPELNHLQLLIRDGAVARVNPRGAKGFGNLRAAITLNTGARADARDSAAEVLMPDERLKTEPVPAHEIYRRRSGLPPPSPEALVNLGIGELLHLNLPPQVPHQVHVGALGDAVHRAGGLTAALGNSDTGLGEDNGRNRLAALAVMDGTGCVDLGDVSRTMLLRDTAAPFGVRTDRARLVRELDAALAHPRVRLIGLEFGDTYRAGVYGEFAAPDHAERLMSAAFKSADDALGAVMNRLDPRRDMLIVLSLSVPRLNQGELPPLLVWGSGFSPGLLRSGSTRRAAIVTLPDVTATILDRLGARNREHVLGRTLTSETHGTAAQRISLLNRAGRIALVTDTYLRPVAFILIGLLEAVLILTVALVVWQASLAHEGIVRCLSATLGMLPIALFVLYVLNVLLSPQFEVDWLIVMFFSFGLASMMASFSRYREVLFLVLWLFCIMATKFGSELDSIFGYSTYFGGRFYGIGNATMAVLIGLSLTRIGSNNVIQPVRVAGLGLSVTVFLGVLGSNFGGAVGTVCTFGILLWKLSGKRLQMRYLLALGVALILAISLLALLDAGRPIQDRSHLGRWVGTIQAEGPAPLIYMVVTKARVWGHSFSHWYWDIALGSILIASLIVFGFCRERTARVLADRPALNATLYAFFLGGTLTTLVNDSGPVIPCLMAVYALMPVLGLLLREGGES